MLRVSIFLVLLGLVAVQATDCRISALSAVTNTGAAAPLTPATWNPNNYNPLVTTPTTVTLNVASSVTYVKFTITMADPQAVIKLDVPANTGFTAQYYSSGQTTQALACGSACITFRLMGACSGCSDTYYITVCKHSTVVGDPQFTGLNGQSYQVHGVAGEVYNIISDSQFNFNSKFVFLTHGVCPVLDGQRAKGCWTHPGTYLGELGFQTCSGDKLKVISGAARHGFEQVSLNGEELEMGRVYPFTCDPDAIAAQDQHDSDVTTEHAMVVAEDKGYVVRNSSHVLTIRISSYLIELENSDMYCNERVRVMDWSSLHSHGLLGQTWRKPNPKTANKALPMLEGEIDDYVVAGKDLFGSKFPMNQFKPLTPQ